MESKRSTVVTVLKGFGTGSMIAALAITMMLLMQGCSIFISPTDIETMDSMSQALSGCVDSKKIEYAGEKEYNSNAGDISRYDYLITDIKADNSVELLNMYEAANDVFKTGEYEGNKVEIMFFCNHFQSGVRSSVASFRNYDEDGRICDYICEINVYGIDDMAEDYDPDYSYQLNEKEFWDQFTGEVTVIYTDYVEYLNSFDDKQAEREAVEDYLLAEYGDYITFEDISVMRSSSVPNVNWEITVDADSIENGSEYDSVTELSEAIRHSLDDYYSSLDGEIGILHMRTTFILTLSGTGKTWSFSNYYTATEEFLDGYDYIVNYWNATVEELCALEDVTAIYMYNRDEDVVVQVLDSVEGIERMNCTLDSEVEEELASKYPDVAFD